MIKPAAGRAVSQRSPSLMEMRSCRRAVVLRIDSGVIEVEITEEKSGNASGTDMIEII